MIHVIQGLLCALSAIFVLCLCVGTMYELYEESRGTKL
jgi:hypothetical protein